MQALQHHFSWFFDDKDGKQDFGDCDCDDEHIRQLGFWESVFINVHLEQVHVEEEEAIDLSESGNLGIMVFLGFLKKKKGNLLKSGILKDNICPPVANSSVFYASCLLFTLLKFELKKKKKKIYLGVFGIGY